MAIDRTASVTMRFINKLGTGTKSAKADIKSVETQGKKSADKVEDEFDHASKDIQRNFSDMKAVGVAAFAAVTIAVAAATAAMKKAMEAAANQEEAERQLADAMKIANDFTEEGYQNLLDFASARQAVTRYGDEDTLSVMANLRAYGMNSDELKTALTLTQDLATAKKMDLRAASELIGKAFVGETGTLSRYGIVLDDNLEKTEKWAAVQEKVAASFGGAAELAVDSFTGQIEQIRNYVGDLWEDLGVDLIAKFRPHLDTFSGILRDAAQAGLTWKEILDAARPELVALGVDIGKEVAKGLVLGVKEGLLIADAMIEEGMKEAGETLKENRASFIVNWMFGADEGARIAENWRETIEAGLAAEPIRPEALLDDAAMKMPDMDLPQDMAESFRVSFTESLGALEPGEYLPPEKWGQPFKDTLADAQVARFNYSEQLRQMGMSDAELQRENVQRWLEDETMKYGASDELTALHQAKLTEIEQQGIADREGSMMQHAIVAGSIFGGMANLAKAAGEEGTEAAKGFAVAEATMHTYAAAVAAYKSTAAIPVVGPALAPIAAAAAIASGLANVAQIMKMQHGGEVHGPGGIDNVPAMLTRGEYVMPVEQSQTYRPMLDAMRANRMQQGGEVSPIPFAATGGGGVNLTMSYSGVVFTEDEAMLREHARQLSSYFKDADKEFLET